MEPTKSKVKPFVASTTSGVGGGGNVSAPPIGGRSRAVAQTALVFVRDRIRGVIRQCLSDLSVPSRGRGTAASRKPVPN
jgi:hypothetical protein